MLTCDDILVVIARKYQVNISDLRLNKTFRDLAICDLNGLIKSVLPKQEHLKAIQYLCSGGYLK